MGFNDHFLKDLIEVISYSHHLHVGLVVDKWWLIAWAFFYMLQWGWWSTSPLVMAYMGLSRNGRSQHDDSHWICLVDFGGTLWKSRQTYKAQHLRMGNVLLISSDIQSSRRPHVYLLGGLTSFLFLFHAAIRTWCWFPSEQHFSLERQYLQPSLCKKKQKHPFCFSIGWINHHLSFLSCSLPASGFALRNLIEKNKSPRAQQQLRNFFDARRLR